MIFFWWAGLALLDLVTALYCVSVEKEEFRLVGYSIIYRMFFILIIDICKAMSTIEEFLGIRMTWGKLERVGAANVECKNKERKRLIMELIPILSTIILVATISTFLLAIGAYILYKVREKTRKYFRPEVAEPASS